MRQLPVPDLDINGGKKKYACDICGKTYGYRDSVYRHKRTHEGKTVCFVCGKVLSCLPTLREHLRYQHSMSQEEVASSKPHVCGVCGRRYLHRVSLSHHVKKHQGLTTCRLCGKVLGIMAHLRTHLEIVHGMSREAVRALVPTRQYAWGNGYSSLAQGAVALLAAATLLADVAHLTGVTPPTSALLADVTLLADVAHLTTSRV
ncbi:zinc finger protein 77-like [Pollicipes pollicipes]|uniref:zinc finger protein 77-like n=1 Tax=Pollicipes pollicipes TaxID=41117 RepID=UPI0018850D4F|nr:zinc finger protein 77-like [Pollicipes pollicipes]